MCGGEAGCDVAQAGTGSAGGGLTEVSRSYWENGGYPDGRWGGNTGARGLELGPSRVGGEAIVSGVGWRWLLPQSSAAEYLGHLGTLEWAVREHVGTLDRLPA